MISFSITPSLQKEKPLPTIVSHVAVAVAAGMAFAPRDVPNHFWALAVVKSELLWVWLPSLAVVALSTVIRSLYLRH